MQRQLMRAAIKARPLLLSPLRPVMRAATAPVALPIMAAFSRSLHSNMRLRNPPTPTPWPFASPAASATPAPTTPAPTAAGTPTVLAAAAPASPLSSSAASSTSVPSVPAVAASSDAAAPTAGTAASSAASSMHSSIELELQRGVPFNTYELIVELRSMGFDESQSIAIMKTLLRAQEASLAKLIATYRSDLTTIKLHTDTNLVSLKAQMEASQSNMLSTYRSELSSLKEHLNEKTFNASLKNDMQQKHIRDSLKAELDAVKADVTDNNRQVMAQQASDRVAFQKLDKEIAQIREAASASANQIALLASREELEKKQNELFKVFFGLIISVGALMLGAMRMLR